MSIDTDHVRRLAADALRAGEDEGVAPLASVAEELAHMVEDLQDQITDLQAEIAELRGDSPGLEH
ncbi:MAG: hypothetical protein ACRBK7_14430 [Acidimicrobiales bacterium]